MKKFKVLLLLVAIAAIVFSCTRNDTTSKVHVYLKSSVVKGSAAQRIQPDLISLKNAVMVQSAVTMDTFMINIREIEFGVDEEYEGEQYKNDTITDRNLLGPFLIDVLSAEARAGLSVAIANLPNLAYDELNFKISKYTQDPLKKIYNHSVFVTGTIDGKRARLWYNNELEFQLKFADTTKFVKPTGADINMFIDLNISRMVNALSSVDLSSAQDRNGDGIIEIGPGDPDGNEALVHYIIEAIHKALDLDDQNDDD